MQRHDRREDRAGVEARRLPLEERSGEILEGDGRFDEPLLVRGHVAIVEAWARHRLGAEETFDGAHVSSFVPPAPPPQSERRRRQCAKPLSLCKETRLQILEHEIELEDGYVVLRR